MPSLVRRRGLPLVSVLVLSLAAACTVPRAQSAPGATEQQGFRLSDAEFWRLSSEMSEPGGYFRSDNFTSNEQTFPTIVNHLRETKAPGGVYMGVGPEQNFHYIVALRPKMVFIIDIRRQAVMQHLMYKALFEMSADRNEFISRLFSMPKQSDLDTAATIGAIWNAYSYARRDPALWQRNVAAVELHLTKTRGIPLDTADLASLRYVYESFFDLGPGINYNGYGRSGGSRPTFSTLTQLADDSGAVRSFLASEESFRVIKDMHARNLIIPVVGNFGGPKAIRAVGDYVRSQKETVTAFYLSNVEQYLFEDGILRTFYDNVASLPLDSASVFLRPLTSGGGRGGMIVRSVTPPDGRTVVWTVPSTFPGARSPQRGEVCPILPYLASVREGRARSWSDARACRL
jgi:hypothetical protein